jgi:hypothetical protein
MECINAGTMVGVEAVLIEFLEAWNNYVGKLTPEVMKAVYYVPDQVIVNVIIRMKWTGNVKLRFYRGVEEYVAMWRFFGIRNVTYRLGDFKLWKDGPYPLVVHMYDRGRKICRSVSEVCPALFPTGHAYTRCFQPGY